MTTSNGHFDLFYDRRVVERIEQLLADYLRRSLVNGRHDVPLADVIRDLRAVCAEDSVPERSEELPPASAASS